VSMAKPLHPGFDGPSAHPSPQDSTGGRRAAREQRRADSVRRALVDRIAVLNDTWRVVDLSGVTATRRGFLAIGSGGVFALTLTDHGRSRIAFAGDNVQIDGRRSLCVEEARLSAQAASERLSASAGVSIPVVPLLVLTGSGKVSFYGLPRRCIVTSHQGLPWVLHASGQRLSPTTVNKVFALARHPRTWLDESGTRTG
jgi:hypothetical protein